MKKLFAMFALLLACSASAPAFATVAASAADISSIDVSKLTPEQKAQLMTQVTDLQKQSSTNISQTIRTEASAWAELGGNMGRAAVAAAKEIGVATNDFVQTPLGRVTMGIVIYKVLGHDIIKIVMGSSILIFFFSMSLYFALKKKFNVVEYENIPVLGGLYIRKIVKTSKTDQELTVTHFIAAGICALVGLIVGLNIIF